MLSGNMKELSLHSNFYGWVYYDKWFTGWANLDYVPRKVNFIFATKPYLHLIASLQSCLPILRKKVIEKQKVIENFRSDQHCLV